MAGQAWVEQVPTLVWREHLLPQLSLEEISSLRLCSRELLGTLTGLAHLHRAWWECKTLARSGDLVSLKYRHRHLAAESRGYITLSFFYACKYGQLEMAEWLQRQFRLTGREVLRENAACLRSAFGQGHPRVVNWLIQKFEIRGVDWVAPVVSACHNGHYRAVAWLCDNHPVPRSVFEAANFAAFRESCEQGFLFQADWIRRRYELADAEVRLATCRSLRTICAQGHIDVARWLHVAFGVTLTAPEAAAALRDACASDRLDVAYWLHLTFKPSPAAILAVGAFVVACRNNHLLIAYWLVAAYGLSAADVRRNGNQAFRECCLSGHLHMAGWLYEGFLNESDLDCVSPAQVAARAHHDVARWLAGLRRTPPAAAAAAPSGPGHAAAAAPGAGEAGTAASTSTPQGPGSASPIPPPSRCPSPSGKPSWVSSPYQAASGLALEQARRVYRLCTTAAWC